MSILQMSLSGAVLIVAIVVLRALTMHKLPKRTFSILWLVALCRLLIPVSIPFRFSLLTGLSLLRHAGEAAPAAAKVAQDIVPAATATLPASGGAGIGLPVGSGTLPPVLTPLALVWLIGACLMAAFFTVSFIKCRREFRTALPTENDLIESWRRAHPLRRCVLIRQSDRIAAPLTYGVFRPVVLLPKLTDWADKEKLDFILAHEYVHIRRFDALAKLLFTASICVHWFNPLVWVMYMLANRDLEMSCDESVVRMFGGQCRSAYARSLISLEESKSRWRPLYSGFSKYAIERRIISVMKFKKTTLIAMIAAVLTIVCVTVVFATTAKSETINITPTSAAVSASAASAESPAPSAEAVKTSDEEVAKMKAALPSAKPVSEEALPQYWKMGALNVEGVPYLPLVDTAESLGYTVKTESHAADPRNIPEHPNTVEYNYEIFKDRKSLGLASINICDGTIVSYIMDEIFTKTSDRWDKPVNNRVVLKDGIVYMPAQFFKEALDTGDKLP